MIVTLGPLLVHDGADPDHRRVFRPFDIWDKTPTLDALLVPSPGGGAVVAGDWVEKEKYGTLAARAALGDRAEFEAFRRELLAACPVGVEVELSVVDDVGETRRMFVLRHDEVDVEWFKGRWAAYTLPLVAPDPGKYPLTGVGGTMGTWVGEHAFRTYADPEWVRTYAGPDWYQTYQVAAGTPSGYPEALTLDSPGEADSDRVVVTVVGPLSAGDWFLLDEGTGDRMWVQLAVLAGQELVFDCHARTASLNGGDVTSYMQGEWLRLPPGQSTWRLAAGIASEGYATVAALPRYT